MPQIPKNITINTNTVAGATFAQLVGITVSDGDLVTLEFVYVNPRDASLGNVVSRVTLHIAVANDLACLIPQTIKIHNDKNKNSKEAN